MFSGRYKSKFKRGKSASERIPKGKGRTSRPTYVNLRWNRRWDGMKALVRCLSGGKDIELSSVSVRQLEGQEAVVREQDIYI